MEEWEKAWAAAMIDSRGHLIHRRNRQRAAGSEQITLMIETKHHEIAERLSAMTGTKPEPQEFRPPSEDIIRRGCTEHCPEPHVHVDSFTSMPTVTRWAVTGASAAIVLWNLRPYMATTREPWDWALDQILRQLKMTGQGSGAIKESARRLKRIGWTLPPIMEQLATEAA